LAHDFVQIPSSTDERGGKGKQATILSAASAQRCAIRSVVKVRQSRYVRRTVAEKVPFPCLTLLPTWEMNRQ
jgi:hypothetical protein